MNDSDERQRFHFDADMDVFGGVPFVPPMEGAKIEVFVSQGVEPMQNGPAKAYRHVEIKANVQGLRRLACHCLALTHEWERKADSGYHEHVVDFLLGDTSGRASLAIYVVR